MSCIISAPSTNDGKTTLSLLISCWAASKGIKLQSFKVGPDYLDQQQLSSLGHPVCRNLDVFMSGEKWVKKTFLNYTKLSNIAFIEGAMGLFEGLGSTNYSSTAHVAKILNLPVIFIIDAKGKVGSLLAIFKGFQNLDKEISIKGIVFNNVNSDRHKKLIQEVFDGQKVKIIGFLPTNNNITIERGNLGLISPAESANKIDIDYYSNFAEKNLNFRLLMKFLKTKNREVKELSHKNIRLKEIYKPVAIAEDQIFHFQYPETKEYLGEMGIPLIPWNLYEDEEIPHEAHSLIIPGGFPEKYAEQISNSKKSLNSLKDFYKRGFIYAECGGMMLLANSIKVEDGTIHKMAGILPFDTKKGRLSIGYRYIKGNKNSQLIKKDQNCRGHEFHYWQIDDEISRNHNKTQISSSFVSPWEIKSWGTKYKKEGWSNENLHASWIHLHFPSNIEATESLLKKIEKRSFKFSN